MEPSRPCALIIEDDPQLGQIFTLALQGNFATELIPEGHDALVRLDELVPEVIVLDLHLPGVAGKDILAHIRGDERFNKSHIILATADARQAELLMDEVDLVLLKPVSPLQLRELATRLRSSATLKGNGSV